MSLRDALEGLVEEDGAYAIDAPEQWSQGRTLYGGMTAALSYEAVRRALPDISHLRSAQFAFIGPASGRLRLTPEVLRRGRSATIVGVDCRNELGLAARSIFTFGAPRESRVRHDLAPMPDVPPPEDCEPFHKRGKPRGFIQNFELRLASGSRIFDGATNPEFAVWVRLIDEAGVDPMTNLLALADSLPPAAMVVFPEPAMISTMTWSIDLHQPLIGDGWRLLSAASEQTADGYSLQNMALWSQSGERLVVGRQAVAIFI